MTDMGSLLLVNGDWVVVMFTRTSAVPGSRAARVIQPGVGWLLAGVVGVWPTFIARAFDPPQWDSIPLWGCGGV